MSSIDDAKHTGSCLASSVSIQDEIALGLNALPARISVVSGQIQSPPTCGSWCATAPDPASPCKMDEDVVPCETDFYCTTTCALWSLNTSTEKRPKLSCSMFTRFDGYPFTHVFMFVCFIGLPPLGSVDGIPLFMYSCSLVFIGRISPFCTFIIVFYTSIVCTLYFVIQHIHEFHLDFILCR